MLILEEVSHDLPLRTTSAHCMKFSGNDKTLLAQISTRCLVFSGAKNSPPGTILKEDESKTI